MPPRNKKRKGSREAKRLRPVSDLDEGLNLKQEIAKQYQRIDHKLKSMSRWIDELPGPEGANSRLILGFALMTWATDTLVSAAKDLALLLEDPTVLAKDKARVEYAAAALDHAIKDSFKSGILADWANKQVMVIVSSGHAIQAEDETEDEEPEEESPAEDEEEVEEEAGD
jgi:hypothetical protein